MSSPDPIAQLARFDQDISACRDWSMRVVHEVRKLLDDGEDPAGVALYLIRRMATYDHVNVAGVAATLILERARSLSGPLFPAVD